MIFLRILRRDSLVAGIALLCFGSHAGAGDSWPDYRGPSHDGHSTATKLPLHWSESENVIWKTPIHGRAWSSPVVTGDQVWLTTATADGRELSVLCVNTASGKVVHDEILFRVPNPQFAHAFNSYASPSPVIDGGFVYFTFGSPGTACIDRSTRKVVWKRTDLVCDHFRGAGSSPFLYEDLIILTMDGADFQYLIALDKRTGNTVWRTDRSTDFGDLEPNTGKPKRGGDFRKGYSTPILVTVAGKDQLISPGARATFAYDPHSGKEIWSVRYANHSSAARSVTGDGLVFLSTGYSKAEILAVRLGGKGDVTDSNIAWSTRKAAPNKPSPIFHDGNLYAVTDGGIASCLNTQTGKVKWQGRLGGEFSAALLFASGNILCFSQEGKAFVFKASPKGFEKLSENQLNNGFMASPAIVKNTFIMRTKTHLYSIEEKE